MRPIWYRPATNGPATAIILVSGLALSGCGGTAPDNPQGEWAGTMKTEQGRCPDTMPSRLLVEEQALSFVPGSGVLVLTGTRKPGSDRLHAQLSLLDMNHKPLPMVFEGTLAADGSRIDGTYGTPACRASVTLMRPQDHGLQRALGN